MTEQQQQQQTRLQRMRVDRAPGDWLSSICQASGGEASEKLQLSASGGGTLIQGVSFKCSPGGCGPNRFSEPCTESKEQL